MSGYHFPSERYENRQARSRRTTPTTPQTWRLIVRCEDGVIRHLDDSTVEGGSFTNRLDALRWADQGHCCTNRHSIEKVETNGSEGCIVLHNIDGPTLWDCECTSCVAIQNGGE